MTTFNSLRSGLLAACIAVAAGGTAAAVGPAGSAAASSAMARPPAPRPYTVTLVTGDQVTIASAEATVASVKPAAGREHIAFDKTVAGGHLLVVPADAGRLLQTQRVDRRLFDVTELVRLGYDDTRRSTVPLIMQSTAMAALKSLVRDEGAALSRDLPSVRSIAVTARKDRVAGLWAAISAKAGGPRKIWLDGIRKPLLDRSVPQIGAPQAWASGYTGKGMQVAVLDTGVDGTHPDLAGRIAAVKDFTGTGTQDEVGHGTHVASIIAGNGAASGGKYKGVAPEASILAGKVCGSTVCTDSAILAGMQWAAQDEHARVISMSLGGPDGPGTDPLEEAVNTLTEQTGALFVLAAGNSGSDPGTVESPGSADAALSVAAVDKSDVMASFSSRGPRNSDGGLKPDIAAPGVDIVAARAKGTQLGEPATDYPDSYVSASGTSMATPHVSGAAILLAEQHPDWKAAQLKATLMGSAQSVANATVLDQGAGRVDVAHAIKQQVSADPPALSFGRAAWPHTDDVPVRKTLTYHNTGATEVTLNLTLTPAGPFALSADRVTVAAGGSAEVTVTADTRGDRLPEATYSAELTASGAGVSLVTPAAIDKESEHHLLTLRHVGLDGKPSAEYFTQLLALDGEQVWFPYDASGTVTMRLPKGRYSTAAYLDTSAAGDTSQQSMIFQPLIDLTADTTITFDARTAGRVSQTVPDRTAVTQTAEVNVSMTVDGAPIAYGTSQRGFQDNRVGRVGTDDTVVTGFVGSSWATKNATYFVAEPVPGTPLIHGYSRRFAADEFATDVQSPRGGADKTLYQFIRVADRDGRLLGELSASAAARDNRVNYISATTGLQWSPMVVIGARKDFIAGTYLTGTTRTYRAGEHARTRWGAAPYGPVFNSSSAWFRWQDDLLVVQAQPTGDADGHVGWDTSQDTTTKLYRDDALLDSEPGWTAVATSPPDGPGTYRVEQHTEGSSSGLATTVDSVFTFASRRPTGDDPTVVSVVTVRAIPALDRDNTARAGSTGHIPLSLRDQTGAAVPAHALTADVSFDDGTTWTPARIAGSTATVNYPQGSGFVSLRLHGRDATGATVTQTVIRAYRFR